MNFGNKLRNLFPSKDSRSEEGNVMLTSSVSSNDQQISDFKLALQIQQDDSNTIMQRDIVIVFCMQ